MQHQLHNSNLFFKLLMVLLGIAIIFPSHVMAQVDYGHLEKALPAVPDDTAKVNTLLRLGEHFCSRKNDKALMFLQEAYTIASSLDYQEGIGKSLMWQGRVYYYKSNYGLADKYYDKAKPHLETAGSIDALSFWYMAKAFNLQLTGDYVQAIEMAKQAIELSKQTGNKRRMATCNLTIGTILLDRRDVDNAMNYFKESLALAREIDCKVSIANTLTSFSNAYKAKGSLDSSLIFSREALNIYSDLKNDRLIASSEHLVGATLIQLGRYAEAERSLQHAVSIFKKLDEETGVIITNMSIADAMNKQGKPEGIDLANLTLQEALKIDSPNLLSTVYNKLSAIYAFNHDYEKAFEYQTKHKTIEDSLFTSEKERIMTEMEAIFQAEKRDSQIQYLTIKNKTQRKNNILLGILIVFFAAGMVLLLFLFKIKSTAFNRQQKLLEQEKIIHAQEKQIAVKEKQLLSEQLESKNRELASKALEMLRYNDAISSIINKLETLSASLNNNQEVEKPIKDIIHQLETHTKQNIWNEFEKIFKNIHSGFYDKLLSICPELSSTEIKIAALLKLNLTTKEIAAITFKSEGGIKTTRYRLRKKLGLSGDDKLVPFLMQI